MPETESKEKEEVRVTQMDTVAFVGAEYKIAFVRAGSMPSEADPAKKVAYWAYVKTPEFAKAIAEWNNPTRERTRVVRNFREEQRTLRQMKAKLERA